MISELHRMGFQRLRFMPYLYPLAYRIQIGPVSCFSVVNGCHAKSDFPGVTYSSASENEYFGWTDAKCDDACELAVKFVDRFPEIVGPRIWPTPDGCLKLLERWRNFLTGCPPCSGSIPWNHRRTCGRFR
jgi:hypothetical protein